LSRIGRDAFSVSSLIVLAIVLIAARLRCYHEPLEWDTGTYAAIAREMLAGERLYADAWDIKPPGVFATYAAALWATGRASGDPALPVYLLSVTAAIVTMLGVYRAASIAGRTAGMWAAVFWVAMCYDPWTGGNLPNTEVFINAAVAWAFALWVWSPPEMPWKRAIAIGLLFAIASLYKHVALAPMAIMLCFDRGRGSIRRVAIMSAVVAAVWAIITGYFAATGRGWIICQTLFVAPRSYSGGMMHNLLASLRPSNAISKYLLFALPAVALTLVAAARRQGSVPTRAWRLFLGLCIGTHLAVAMPGAFAAHYYQLCFVPLAIGAGWGAAAISETLNGRRQWLAPAATSLALLAMLYPQLDWYRLTGEQWARRQHGDIYMWVVAAVRDADRMLLAKEEFFMWNDEAYAYVLADRRVPATALWREHTVNGPLAGYLTERTLDDLRRQPPELIILWGEAPSPADHPILTWTKANYDPLPNEGRSHFPLFFQVRRGGALQQRLQAPLQ
jgi:hypothetical protein